MQKYAELICTKLDIDPNLVLKKKIRGLPGITAGQLICALISTASIQEAASVLGYTENPVKQCVRSILGPHFLNRKRDFGEGGTLSQWRFTLLNRIEYKRCPTCLQVLPHSRFNISTYNSDGLRTECKACHVANSKKYKLNVLERTPAWADQNSIRNIYLNCPEGYHVDHIVPLRGALVSGLHVPENLQYLPAEENLQKGNKFISE